MPGCSFETNTEDVCYDQNEEKVEEEEDLEEQHLAQFEATIDAIDFGALSDAAIVNRKHHEELLRDKATKSGLSCSVDRNPLFGSWNLIYVITFSDNVKWIARIPGKGGDWEPLDAKKMDNDYLTMEHIRTSTSIPIPKTFHSETTITAVGVPFALTAFIQDTRLSHRWFDKSWITESKRLKILTQLAGYMSQLSKQRFNLIGSLHFGKDGKFSHVGEWIGAHLENMDEHPFGKPYVRGPYQSAREYFLSEWDDLTGAAAWRVAVRAILALAIQSIPDYFNQNDPYTLESPDYDLQNIFVDDDANVTGMIDWDTTITRPFGLGCARYPSWIMNDWNPGYYMYTSRRDSYADREDSSPQELMRWRRHYANAWAGLDLPKYDRRETELSHIMVAINIAVHNRFCRQYIAKKLLDYAFRGNWPFTYKHCLAMLQLEPLLDCEDGDLTQELEDLKPELEDLKQEIAEAFHDMWHAEWEGDEKQQDSYSEDVSEAASHHHDQLPGVYQRLHLRAESPGNG